MEVLHQKGDRHIRRQVVEAEQAEVCAKRGRAIESRWLLDVLSEHFVDDGDTPGTVAEPKD